MLWIQFGNLRLITSRYGQPKHVGEWALHLQCPWYFTQNGVVILADSDFYYDTNTDTQLEYYSDKSSAFQENARELNDKIKATHIAVHTILYGESGAFDLLFNEDLKLTVIPAKAYKDVVDVEAWRLFEPNSSKPHFVFPSKTG